MLLLSGVFYGLSYVFDAISASDRLNGWATDKLSEGTEERQSPPDEEQTHDMLHGHAQAARASAFQRTWPVVEAYDGPVLVGHGADEPLQAYAEELAERVGGDVAFYSGGHLAPMEHTDEVAGLVREFLEDVDRETQAAAVRE